MTILSIALQKTTGFIMKTIAIIPAYNEEKNIENIISQTKKYVDHILVINDGSTDKTRELAKKAGAEVFSHKKNQGLGITIRTGYLLALNMEYDIVVQIDADGQYNPSEIPALVRPILEDDADMVLGSRLENLMYKMPRIKKMGNKAFTWVLRKMTHEDIKDGQTGFRAIRRDVLETALPSSKFSYTQEMIIRVAKEGWRIKSVPIHFYPRYDDKSRLFGSSLAFAFRGWVIILRTIRDYHPLSFFGFPGLLLGLSGFIVCLYVLAMYLMTGLVSPKMPTLILGVLLLLSGIQLFFAGMTADMIKTHPPNGTKWKKPPGNY